MERSVCHYSRTTCLFLLLLLLLLPATPIDASFLLCMFSSRQNRSFTFLLLLLLKQAPFTLQCMCVNCRLKFLRQPDVFYVCKYLMLTDSIPPVYQQMLRLVYVWLVSWVCCKLSISLSCHSQQFAYGNATTVGNSAVSIVCMHCTHHSSSSRNRRFQTPYILVAESCYSCLNTEIALNPIF